MDTHWTLDIGVFCSLHCFAFIFTIHLTGYLPSHIHVHFSSACSFSFYSAFSGDFFHFHSVSIVMFSIGFAFLCGFTCVRHLDGWYGWGCECVDRVHEHDCIYHDDMYANCELNFPSFLQIYFYWFIIYSEWPIACESQSDRREGESARRRVCCGSIESPKWSGSC